FSVAAGAVGAGVAGAGVAASAGLVVGTDFAAEAGLVDDFAAGLGLAERGFAAGLAAGFGAGADLALEPFFAVEAVPAARAGAAGGGLRRGTGGLGRRRGAGRRASRGARVRGLPRRRLLRRRLLCHSPILSDPGSRGGPPRTSRSGPRLAHANHPVKAMGVLC